MARRRLIVLTDPARRDATGTIKENDMTRKIDNATNDSPDRLIPVGDVAAMLGVSRRTVWRLADAGKLPPPLRIGGSLRWRLADVQQWIANGCPIITSQETGK